jgi:2-isopropylmalate synthase
LKRIVYFDTTLRDGAQGLGISFTVEDKIKIIKKLDELGIDYIEAGNPGSNPKDLEFFARVKKLKLRHSKITAFGSTRRKNTPVEEDGNILSLLDAGTEAVTVFGKSWDFQVTDILKTTLEENLLMIADTVRYFKSKGKETIFDAEHFFDGYRDNPAYAFETLRVAYEAGADSLCLCDTKGGTLPGEVQELVKRAVEAFSVPIGIHCHNDMGLAVANSMAAVQSGALQVQGTINGLGERCGNTNLCTMIPNLQLFAGYEGLSAEQLRNLTLTARFVSEVANVAHDDSQPFVGSASFAHKAGMHADAVSKNPRAYELFDPSTVGNQRTFLLSEVAGRSAILDVINRFDDSIEKDSPKTKQVLDRLKEMESQGYQYEGAESSFELLVKKVLGLFTPSFQLKEFKVIVNEPSLYSINSSALIKILVGDQAEITAAEGYGPVNALDNAMRKALEHFYPEIGEIKLTAYKVRVLDSTSATAAKVRVLIESSDGSESWTTIGVSSDVIEASWIALVDSVEYKLSKGK